MQVPADAMPYAIVYLRITTLGILGNMGYNFNAGILRGLGNSTSSLLFLGISCVTNIVLDLVLTAGLGMGVTGVAIATAASLFLSWMFSILPILPLLHILLRLLCLPGRTLVPGTTVVYAAVHGRYRSVPASSPLQGDYL